MNNAAAESLLMPSLGNGRRSRKTSEFIARDLVNYIVSENLPAGARLPTEKDMVESFGVGRTTLREALRLLETRGVITIRSGPRGGPVVRCPNAADLNESLTLILQFEGASVADVIDARRSFEPIVARLAARHINDEKLDLLQKTIDAISANLDDPRVFPIENQRFHSIVAESSGSKVLRIFTETLKSLADDALLNEKCTADRRKSVARAHQRIVNALRARDEEEAENMMRLHIDEAAGYWTPTFSEQISRPVRWAD
jgi:DNA-binding FadR family transcriptional regulator